jgi:hypothetical protein
MDQTTLAKNLRATAVSQKNHRCAIDTPGKMVFFLIFFLSEKEKTAPG